MLIFSSTGHRSEEAFALWRTAISAQFVPLRPEPVRPLETFFAELRSCAIGPLTLSDIRSTGQHVYRDQREIARSRAEALFLNLQVSGKSGLVRDGEAVLTRPGDLFLVDARRPFSLACGTPMRHLCVAIPRDALTGTAVEWQRGHGVVMSSGHTAVAGLLRDYLLSLNDVADSLEPPVVSDVADHVIALVGFVMARYQGNVPAPRESVRAAVFAKACRIIERRMQDPSFDPAALARAARVSLRYLQLLFQEHGTSPMRAIVQRRTALAMRMLREPANRQRTITEIALSCGFRDLSHFGRVFGEMTGHTPREWRRSCEE